MKILKVLLFLIAVVICSYGAAFSSEIVSPFEHHIEADIYSSDNMYEEINTEMMDGEEGDEARYEDGKSIKNLPTDIIIMPLSITAGSITFNEESFIAKGNVVAIYKDLVINSDTLEGENASHLVRATGNVTLEQAGEKTYGEELVYNTQDRTGFMVEPNGRTKNIYLGDRPIKGELFYKGGLVKWEPDLFELLSTTITTCDFPEGKKHYQITGKKVEVYPGDVMIIYHATLFLGKYKIWTIPKYVINLRPERRKKQPHPEAGYNKTDGFFIKTRNPYYFNRGSYGDFLLNWAQKRGFSEGVDHYYNGRRGEGQLFVFKQNSQAAGVKRERFATFNRYNFGEGINASMGFSLYQDRVPPFEAPPVMSSSLSVSKQSSYYNSSLGMNFNTFGFENKSVSLNFQHGVRFRKDLRGDFQATYFSNSSPASRTTSLLTKTGFIHTGTDLTTELIFEKSETSPKAVFVERIPEVTFRTPVRTDRWFNIPYQMQLAIGRFLETDTLRTVERTDFLFTSPYKIWELTPHTWLNTYFQYKQDMYMTHDIPTRDLHARYMLSSNLLMREQLFNHMELQTGFRIQAPNGYNPLQFDNLNKFKLLSGELSVFNKDSWRVNVGTAYDLDNKFYQSLIGRLDLRPRKDWRFHIDGTYDINQRRIQNVVGYSDVLIRKDLRFQQWMSYDFGQKKITYQDYALIKDYHDWTMSLIYRGSRQEFFIHATLKAFPDEGVGVGLSPDGPILDPALQQFFR